MRRARTIAATGALLCASATGVSAAAGGEPAVSGKSVEVRPLAAKKAAKRYRGRLPLPPADWVLNLESSDSQFAFFRRQNDPCEASMLLTSGVVLASRGGAKMLRRVARSGALGDRIVRDRRTRLRYLNRRGRLVRRVPARVVAFVPRSGNSRSITATVVGQLARRPNRRGVIPVGTLTISTSSYAGTPECAASVRNTTEALITRMLAGGATRKAA